MKNPFVGILSLSHMQMLNKSANARHDYHPEFALLVHFKLRINIPIQIN